MQCSPHRSRKAIAQPPPRRVAQLRQLVASTQLSVEDQDAEYALREKETSELITDDNYTRHLELGHA